MVAQPGGLISLPTFPGGPTPHRTLESGHDPLITPEQNAALCLNPVQPRVSGLPPAYFIVGGSQGRFRVRNGAVYSFIVNSPGSQRHGGETLEQFAQELRGSQPVIG